MTYQDIITNQQKLVQVLAEKAVEEVLEDENHRFLLQFLFQGPLTVEELNLAFKKSGNEKSDKTIYRYLNKLKKAGLVIEAGKRIYTDENNQIKTQTLFSRIAKIIFTPFNKIDKNPDLRRQSLEITSLVLKDRLKLNSDADLNCLQTKIDNLTQVKNKAIADHFENTENPELISLIQEMDIHELYPILDLASWIILFNENQSIINDLTECFK